MQNRNNLPEIDPERSSLVAKKAMEKTNREYVPHSKSRRKNIRQYTKELKKNLHEILMSDVLIPYADDLTDYVARELDGLIKENVDELNAQHAERK